MSLSRRAPKGDPMLRPLAWAAVLARSASATLLALSLGGLAVAQTAPSPFPVSIPKALVFPNYDNVHPGKDQALEGGAYIARAADGSANFYNPAGLVQAEKFSLNASATGWTFTRLTSDAGGASVTSFKIDNVPGFFGAVVGEPFVGKRNLRFGVSIARLVAWDPGPIDQALTGATGVQGLDRITYSSTSSFDTWLYQVAAAWAPDSARALRLGFSAGVANTIYDSAATLSGAVTSTSGNPGQFLASLRTHLTEWDVVFGVGIQWDVTARLTIGALVRSPGLRVGGGSLFTYESSTLATAQPSATFYYRDENGRFHYELPLEAGLGVGYRFGPAQLELDARMHDASGTYRLYTPSAPAVLTTHNPDGSSSSSSSTIASLDNTARRVFNLAIGGNYPLGRRAKIHGGFFTSSSPVESTSGSPFRMADLYGVTSGVDLQSEHFGLSIGGQYQWGSSPSSGLALGGQMLSASRVKLQSFSILYAFSYSF
jgi:hypothetical protein